MSRLVHFQLIVGCVFIALAAGSSTGASRNSLGDFDQPRLFCAEPAATRFAPGQPQFKHLTLPVRTELIRNSIVWDRLAHHGVDIVGCGSRQAGRPQAS